LRCRRIHLLETLLLLETAPTASNNHSTQVVGPRVEALVMTLNRGWWVAFILAPVAMFTEGSAQAADAVLPHGVHLMPNGRYAQDLCDHDQRLYCMAHRLLPESYRPGDSIEDALRLHPLAVQGGGAGPSDFISAYGLTGNSGGKMVAVVDAPDGTAFTDMNSYRTNYGIPALPQCASLPNTSGTPCFASVDESGGSLNANLGNSGQADGETTLDVQMISAVCPDCSILLVQFPSAQPSDSDFISGCATAKAKGAVACSISWGGGEGGDPDGYSTPGFLVTAAAGDSGWRGGSYPASAPDVLAVGGTDLSGPGQEVAWNQDGAATGSGCSAEFPMPAYQTAYGASKFSGCSMRDMNDVSAAADSTLNGGAIANLTGGQWGGVLGTSAASPMVAAIFTRVGVIDAISADFGFIYTHTSAFHDVTSGSNGSCGNIQCTAGAGWDGPTGIGTPNGSVLATLGTSSGSSSSGSGSSSGGSTSSSSGSSSGGSSGSSGGGSNSSGSSGGGSGSSGGSGGSGSSGGGSSNGGSGGIGSSSGASSGGSSGAVVSPDAGAPGSNNADPTDDGFAQLNAPAGCGCTTVGASGGLDGLALLALGGAATVLVRRRRR
jgi:hypothetical protein